MNEQETVVLSLPLQAVNTIMAGLGKLPLEVSIGVHQYVASEVNRQMQEADAKAKEAAAKAATHKEAQNAKP